MRRLLLAALAGLVSTATSCLSPTIPLPPPSPPDQITASAGGLWDVFGSAMPGATVLVTNEITHEVKGIEGVGSSGRYHVQIAGTQCDLASVEVQVINDEGAEDSSKTNFELAPVMPGVDAQDNPICHP